MSIKVAIRARPFSASEAAARSESVVRMNGDVVEVIEDGPDQKPTHQFTFDNAFWSVNAIVAGNKNPLASQKHVYEKVGTPVVDHVLTGYNACLFAYGQTGSGKTYSMMGESVGDQKGIIPRFAGQIFAEMTRLKKQGVTMMVELSYYEIYCEKVRCLLNPAVDGKFASLKVREHPVTGPYVDGLAKLAVKSEAEFLKLLEDGAAMRITGATDMNAQSSRSHAVCTVYVSMKRVEGSVNKTMSSKLNLVDLAGSERADKTNATGARLAEGSAINQSLSSLGLVISSLSEIASSGVKRYIPYRDSVLTYILKDNLGGNSQTVMLATVSPAMDQLEETMSTLRYAERAKKIVNKAQVNETADTQVISQLQDQIQQLRAQIGATSEADNKAALQEVLQDNEAAMADLKLSYTEKLVETEKVMEEREAKVQKLLTEKEAELKRANSELRHAKEDLNAKDEQIRKLQARIRRESQKGDKGKRPVLISQENMGNVKVAGKVSVRALAKAFETVDNNPAKKNSAFHEQNEEQLLAQLGITKKTLAAKKSDASAEEAGEGDDEDLDLGDDELELDGDDEEEEMLDLDDEELDLADDEDMELDDEELDLDDDELELDDEEEGDGPNESAAVGEQLDDEELELDDDDLELDDDEESTAATESKPQGMGLDESALAEEEDLDAVELEDEDSTAVTNASVTAPTSSTTGGGHVDPNASEPAKAAAQARSRAMTTHGNAPQPAAPQPQGKPAVTRAPKTSEVSTLVVPSHALPNNRFLREPFKVIKVDEGAVFGKTKDRVWDVDFFGKKFNNMDLSGYVSFTMQASHLFRVEKSWSNEKKLTLYFFDAPHPYDLIFSSVERRWRMYELAMLQRRNAVMWCPSLCPDEDNDAVIQVVGTSIERANGRQLKVKGDGKFMVARMPYEVIDFWYGCFNLQSKPLPSSTAALSNFIPKGTNEVYVIGVADVPGNLMGSTALGDFFLSYLGPSYFVLKNTCLDSKDKPKKGNNGMVVIVRRSFIVRMAHADGVELGSIKKNDTQKGDFSAVAVTMSINESSICCILVNATPFMDDNALRSANIRALISSLPLGNTNVDIAHRFDYLMVGGSFGYMNPFTKDDVLVQQMRAGSLLSDFHETKPTPNMTGMMNPMRVLYNVRPKNSRIDVKKYDADPHLKLPNVGVAADIFTQRSFLSTFGEQVPHVQFILNGLKIKPTRMPQISGMELHLYAPWLDGSPLINPMMRQGEFIVPTGTLLPLRPIVHNHEFLRLQSVNFTLMGVVSASKDKKKGVVASGSFSLKNNFTLGEPMEFQFNMTYRTCTVGLAMGSILQVNVGDNRGPVLKSKAGGKGTEAADAALSTSHLMTVQCDENQVMDKQGAWSPSLYPDGPWDWSDFRNPGVQARREGFSLPDKSWKWVQEWKHESREENKEGWQYATNFSKCDFTPKQNDAHKARRRRWNRVMQAPDAIALHNYVSNLA